MYRIFMMRRWILLVVLVQFAYGYQETYRISQLSPKSVADERFHTNVLLQTSHVENVAFSLDPSNKYDDIEFNPKDIISEKETENHVMVERSAEPSRDSRSINIEEIPSSNNNEIDNEIVLHNKRKYYEIVPTKTLDYTVNDDDESVFMSTGFGDKLDFKFPGEGKRAPKGRALAPTGPKIRPTVVQPPTFATTLKDQARQNTEIQNIITGIVKLLNGNVNVQANTQLLNGRPRPMASRINNRGPPRITDVPLLPDYEKPMTPPPPVFHSTKTPPPYPFDRPPGINLPDQMVPPKTTRPGFHRPMLPWQRPRPRPIPNRRPNPGLPVYKPTLIPPPEFPEDEKQDETIVNENETNYENNIHHDDIIPFITLPESTTEFKNIAVKIEKEVQITTETSTTTTTESTTSTTTTTTQKPETTTEKQTEPTTQKTTEKPKTEKPMKPDKDKKKETSTEKDKSRDKYKVDAVEKPKTEYPIIEIESSIADVSSTKAPIAPTPTVELSRHTPVIAETTAIDIKTSSINTQPISTIPYQPYRPRPGIVLDDTDFKPHATRHRTDASIITAAETRLPGYGEIFDVTVSAIQGPGEKGASIHIENVNIHNEPDIIVTPSGSEGFVSIDGQRTYLNLFDTTSQRASIAPTRLHNPPYHTAAPQPTVGAAIGTGVAIPADDVPLIPPRPQKRPPNRPPYRRPQTTVRIDTCIVGDDSTCDHAQNEKCRTEAGISSCQCRPGYARRTHRDPCRGVVSLVLNLRVDRIDDKKVAWDEKLSDKESDSYHQMSFEAVRAIHSAFSMTPYSDEFVSSSVNSIHQGEDRKVYVNYTILMEENLETTRPSIATEIQKHIMGVIRRRSNNVGISALWVDTPAGSVLPLIDLDECSSPELNDCHALASCNNTWGAFKCTCADTTLDSATLPHMSGRNCRVCPDSQCSGRGFCRYTQGRPHCNCYSGYYGSTCEIDGDVIGVSVGVSLAAILVIGVTLTLLMLWSRKWSREQKAAGMGSPVFNYMAANTVKTPPVGQPPYQVTLEERMRWSQLAEAMAQASHYASADLTQTMATRPSSAMFGYPTLPPVPLPRMHGVHTGTLNTVTSRANTAASYNIYGYTNHMAESASSEASSHVQDRADLLVPRPKSRARSMHNQTGIYYDVDYENTEPIYGTKGIPLSTYTVSRGPPFYR